jgi:hypothetical protein
MEKKKSNIEYFKKIIDVALDGFSNFTYPKYSAESIVEAKLTKDELQAMLNPPNIRNATKMLIKNDIQTDHVNKDISKLVLLFAMEDSLSESISKYIENIKVIYNAVNDNSDESEEESLPEDAFPQEILVLNLLNNWLGTSDIKELSRIANKFSWSNEVGAEVEKLFQSFMIKQEFINMLDTLNLTKATEYLQKACEYLPSDTDEEKIRKDTLKEFMAGIMQGLAPVDADKKTEQLKRAKRPKDYLSIYQ